MTVPRWEDRALSFGASAEDYQAHRPSYPPEAVAWLLPREARRVVDVGAGTGKLTDVLLAAGIQVVAVEPDAAMLAVLTQRLPQVEAHVAPAEALPLPDASVDAVVAAQAWHWFDHPRALAEARRVLRPRGALCLLWNARELASDWELELEALDPTGSARAGDQWPPGLPRAAVEEHSVPWQQEVTPRELRREHATHSAVALLPEPARTQRLDQIEQVARAEAGRRRRPTVALSRRTWCFRHAFSSDEVATAAAASTRGSLPSTATTSP